MRAELPDKRKARPSLVGLSCLHLLGFGTAAGSAPGVLASFSLNNGRDRLLSFACAVIMRISPRHASRSGAEGPLQLLMYPHRGNSIGMLLHRKILLLATIAATTRLLLESRTNAIR